MPDRIAARLKPGVDEEDAGFRQEIVQRSHLSPENDVAGAAVSDPGCVGGPRPGTGNLGTDIHGAFTGGASKTAWSRRYPRFLAALPIWLAAAVLVSSSGGVCCPRVFGPDPYIPAYVTIVLLMAVVNIPLRPMHTLSLGLAIEAFHLASYGAEAHWSDHQVPPLDFVQHFCILIVIALCTARAAMIYSERASSYHAHQHTVGVCRAALSESAVDTLALAAAKRANAPPSEQACLATIEDDVPALSAPAHVTPARGCAPDAMLHKPRPSGSASYRPERATERRSLLVGTAGQRQGVVEV